MRRLSGLAAAAVALGVAVPAFAQDGADDRRLDAILAAIADQQKQIEAQRLVIEAQQRQLTEQQAAIERLRSEALSQLRGAGEPTPSVTLAQVEPVNPNPPPAAPTTAVGEAPAATQTVEVESVPEASRVLTPKGRLIVEPSFRYVHASNNRLVFRGVEIVTGVQIGALEASDADRNAIAPALSFRYGLTDRIEVEADIPWLKRSDRVTTVAQRDETVTRNFALTGEGLGDIEFGVRYQLNTPRPGRPVLIASARYKTATGKGPYDVDFDAAGVASELATGSGFQAAQVGLNFLYPTDPAVLFGGISYLHNFGKDIDREIGQVLVGEVDPGDTFSANVGFGFALNPDFSFSLGYSQTHVSPSVSILGGTRQKSNSLEIGSFAFGWSLRLSDHWSLNNSYEIGVTSDSPDVAVTVRLPYRF